MKKIGLVGGISWTSTMDYYRFINEEANKKMGGLNFAECIIYSVNFDKFRTANAAYDWDSTFNLMHQAAVQLENAGAELLMLGANTAHIVAERVAAETRLPLVDIRTATANAILEQKIKKVGLIGTTYTMELDYYKNKISEYGIEVITPQAQADRNYIEKTLAAELGAGIIRDETKAAYLSIINRMIESGAEGIILGCTEIPLFITQGDITVPVFNTTLIHAKAAVALAFS